MKSIAAIGIEDDLKNVKFPKGLKIIYNYFIINNKYKIIFFKTFIIIYIKILLKIIYLIIKLI